MGLAINVDLSGIRKHVEPQLADSEEQMLSEIEAEGTASDAHKADAGS